MPASSNDTHRYSQYERQLFGGLGAALSLYITVVNSVVFALFTRNRRLHRVPGHALIVWLMVTSDIMIGVCALPGYLLDTLSQPEWPLPMWCCDLWILCDYVSTNVGVLSVTAVAFDRFLATNCVFAHKRWMHRANQLRLSAALWLITLARNFLVFPVWAVAGGYRDTSSINDNNGTDGNPAMACSHPIYANTSAALAQRTVALYIPIALLLFFYSAVVYRIVKPRFGRRQQQRYHGAGGSNLRKSNTAATALPIGKSFRMVTCVLASFLLANLPWHVLDNLIMTGRSGIKKSDPIYVLSWILCYANACLNPAFYALMNIHYRQVLLAALMCRTCYPPGDRRRQLNSNTSQQRSLQPQSQEVRSIGGVSTMTSTPDHTLQDASTTLTANSNKKPRRQLQCNASETTCAQVLKVTECVSSL